jgi:hypothetical protein
MKQRRQQEQGRRFHTATPLLLLSALFHLGALRLFFSGGTATPVTVPGHEVTPVHPSVIGANPDQRSTLMDDHVEPRRIERDGLSHRLFYQEERGLFSGHHSRTASI